MKPIVEDAVLGSDLDCRFFDLLNLGTFDPPPSNLVLSNDVRLTDAREPLPGSVTNASVASNAAIVQSKLSLDGNMPTSWFGTTNTTAARGDLAEYAAMKGQPNGFASLDGSGKVPPAQLPATTGTGTVTSVGLTMPSQFSVTGTPVVGAGTLAVGWNNVADLSWFGNKEGASAAPRFYTDPLPVALIPNLDAAKVVSGVFDTALVPPAVGVGASHAPGAVPDPGDGSGGALGTDYLARDMSFKPVPSLGPSYQPTIADPVLKTSTNVTGPLTVAPEASTIQNLVYFYSFTSASAGFQEFPSSGYISLPAGGDVWVYAAHSGYNNSNVVTKNNPNPP